MPTTWRSTRCSRTKARRRTDAATRIRRPSVSAVGRGEGAAAGCVSIGMTMREVPRRVARRCHAGILAVLLAAALTVTAGAHDPGLSSLDVSVTASTIVARLSLSPRDAEVAAALESGGRFADAEWARAAATLGA